MTFIRTDRWLVLLARGWRIEHIDERYWSVLLSFSGRFRPRLPGERR